MLESQNTKIFVALSKASFREARLLPQEHPSDETFLGTSLQPLFYTTLRAVP